MSYNERCLGCAFFTSPFIAGQETGKKDAEAVIGKTIIIAEDKNKWKMLFRSGLF